MFTSRILQRVAEGELFVTPEVAKQVPAADIELALKNHFSGAWGELGPKERARNDSELKTATTIEGYGPEINSLFTASNGVRFSIITVGVYPETFVCPVASDDVLLEGALPPVPLNSC